MPESVWRRRSACARTSVGTCAFQARLFGAFVAAIPLSNRSRARLTEPGR
jgi:hypothetical protein